MSASLVGSNDVFVRNESFPWRTMNGETVLVRVGDSEVDHFNEVGTAVWELLDGKRTITDIARKVAESFDISEEAAAVDIETFLNGLIERQLVIASGPEK